MLQCAFLAKAYLRRRYLLRKVDKRVKRSIRYWLGFAGLFSINGGGSEQAHQPAALVIEGGTLIDGTGGAPVRDSVIIIQGNKIANVGRKGQATYPPNAQVIKADGKFIVPGLWDAHSLRHLVSERFPI